MAKQLKLRRGTTTEHSTFTGAEGEVTVDTTKDTVVVHDGSTAGGIPLAKESAIPTGALASLDTVDTAQIADDAIGADQIDSTSSPTVATLNATTVDLGDWTVTESSGVIYFAYQGTNKAKIDSSGNLTVVGNVTAYGTV